MKSIQKIKLEAEKFFSNSRGSHDWDHTQRVYNICQHIGKKERANLDILKLAALLHDIGRKAQDKSRGKICHAEIGAALAKKLLLKYKFNLETINQVVHCIEHHRFKGGKVPQSKEAKILFDADKLDAIGATGIGRAFLFAGEIGSKLHNNQNIDIYKTKEYSKEDTAYREFAIKLVKIKNQLFTQEAKKMARERHRFMLKFFYRLNKELNGDL